MSELSKFEQLVERARQETPPVVDVTEGVLATVRVSPIRPAEPIDRMAVLFAAAAVLAASIVAMIAWQLVESPMLAELPNPFVVQVLSSQ